MSEIQAGHYYSYTLQRDAPAAFTHELARRMSPLQRAVLSILADFEKSEPDMFQLAFRECRAPVYFATSHGEGDALKKVTDGAYNPDIPMSPAAFQNSVHNAAPAYFSIVHHLQTRHIALSNGFASPEDALLLAYDHILLGDHPAICLIAANEIHPESDGTCARAELFLLFRDVPLKGQRTLHNCKYAAKMPRASTNVEQAATNGETGQSQYADIFGSTAPTFTRHIRTDLGESYTSEWSHDARYPALKDLLPHSGPMLMADRIVYARGLTGCVATVLRKDAHYWKNGAFDALWCVEIIAQCVAAIFGWANYTPGAEPRVGFLVSVDEMVLLEDLTVLPLGAEMLAHVACTHEVQLLAQYAVEMEYQGRVVATARMKFSTTDDSFTGVST